MFLACLAAAILSVYVPDSPIATASEGEGRLMAPLETSKSLLERARDPADATSWRKLIDLYSPLIRRWVRPRVAQAADVDDLVQDVLAKLSSEIRAFEHNQRAGAFRTWLRALTVNRLRVHWRQTGQGSGNPDVYEQLNQLEDPTSALSKVWDDEHDQHVAQTLLESIKLEFQPATWRAFEATVREGRAAADVAEELGMSANAVLIAKSRVLKRLREKGRWLLD